MSTSDQFARACNRLEGYVGTIRVRYLSGAGGTPSIDAWGSMWDINDKDMDVAGWRQYGRAIKASPKIDKLELEVDVDRDEDRRPQEISQEAALCLYAFFGELKENTSIKKFELDIRISLAFSAVDMRYFFQNNPKLREVVLVGSLGSPEQSAHISTAMRDVSLNKLIWHVEPGIDFTSRSAFEQILLACRKVKVLRLNELSKKSQFLSIAELLHDPMTLWEDLYLSCRGDGIISGSNVNLERAENEIVSSLHQNNSLKRLKLGVRGLFGGDIMRQRFADLLCNADSLETVIDSNHALQIIQIAPNGPFCQYRTPIHIEEYLDLNRNWNKMKVIQCKVMKYYFSGNYEASSLANMPLSAVPQVFAIDPSMKRIRSIRKKKKKDDALRCSSIFNIIKSIPEICAVSSRGAVQSGGNVKDDGSKNKRRKLIF